MEDIQNQMNNILENPEMMKKIMAMAQSLSQPQQNQSEPPSKQEIDSFSVPDIDIATIQRLSGLASQAGIDSNQRTLLSALTPYLSRDRISRLEKAMQAAHLAKAASAFLGSGVLQTIAGR